MIEVFSFGQMLAMSSNQHFIEQSNGNVAEQEESPPVVLNYSGSSNGDHVAEQGESKGVVVDSNVQFVMGEESDDSDY
jgi:hypothetical protein